MARDRRRADHHARAVDILCREPHSLGDAQTGRIESDATRTVPTNESTNMLKPDQWEAVLSRGTDRVYRGTERVSSTNALLNLLEGWPRSSHPAEGGETLNP
jgi:hypothetical protein